MALLGSFEVGRGNLKATEGAEAHGAHPKRARVKHDPWTGHLRPAVGEVQVAAHTSLMHLVAHMIMQQDSRRILSTSGCQCPLGPSASRRQTRECNLKSAEQPPAGGHSGACRLCIFTVGLRGAAFAGPNERTRRRRDCADFPFELNPDWDVRRHYPSLGTFSGTKGFLSECDGICGLH
jgi:hypothetical protein